jgi:flagellar motor switch/type III secretory pathway protein FliN
MNDPVQYNQISEKILNTVELPAGTMYLDLNQVSKRLEDRLDLPNIQIKLEKTKWLLKEEIDFLENVEMHHTSFSMLPFDEIAHWFMNINEISKLTTWAMTKDVTAKPFSSEILQDGFYKYLILEAMDSIDRDKLLQDFSLKILPEPKELKDLSLCADIKITYQTKSAYAKLVLSEKLVKKWKDNFFQDYNFLASDIAKTANFHLSINVGKVNLSYAEFNALSEGDFIILDHSYYDPKTHQGSILLTFNDETIYQGKIKQNSITILDYAEFKEDLMEDSDNTTPVKDVPLSIQVEMGKIQMTLEKLMSLKAGEIIETTVNPNDNISLILNNKTIAKGELVKVGEVIGVRILETS